MTTVNRNAVSRKSATRTIIDIIIILPFIIRSRSDHPGSWSGSMYGDVARGDRNPKL